MEQAIAGIAGAIAGVLAQGLVDFFKFKQRTDRQDREHRQAYYHELLTVEDQLRDVAFHTPPHEAPGVGRTMEALFKQRVKGIRTFGTELARRAAQRLDDAWEQGDEQGMIAASRELEGAAAKDVAPK